MLLQGTSIHPDFSLSLTAANGDSVTVTQNESRTYAATHTSAETVAWIKSCVISTLGEFISAGEFDIELGSDGTILNIRCHSES